MTPPPNTPGLTLLTPAHNPVSHIVDTLHGLVHDPLEIPKITVLMPTRRSCRILEDALLQKSAMECPLAGVLGGKSHPPGAVLLPRIMPLADPDLALIRPEDICEILYGDPRPAFQSSGASSHPSPLHPPSPRNDIQQTLLAMACLSKLPLFGASHGGGGDRVPPFGDGEESGGGERGWQARWDVAKKLLQFYEQVTTQGLNPRSCLLGDEKDGTSHGIGVPSSDSATLFGANAQNFLELFLQIWPDILKAHGLVDRGTYRWEILGALQKRMEPLWDFDGPIIACVTNGLLPPTIPLLQTLARHKQGHIVVTGMPSLSVVHRVLEDFPSSPREDGAKTQHQPLVPPCRSSHPFQYIRQLAAIFGTDFPKRGYFPPVGTGCRSPQLEGRGTLLAQMMLPPAPLGTSKDLNPVDDGDVTSREDPVGDIPGGERSFSAADLRTAFADVYYHPCPSEEIEALTIAFIMREGLEDPSKKTALITPDRHLARRVKAHLGRWSLRVDDSAGQMISETPYSQTWWHLLAVARGPCPFHVVLSLVQSGHLRRGSIKPSALSTLKRWRPYLVKRRTTTLWLDDSSPELPREPSAVETMTLDDLFEAPLVDAIKKLRHHLYGPGKEKGSKEGGPRRSFGTMAEHGALVAFVMEAAIDTTDEVSPSHQQEAAHALRSILEDIAGAGGGGEDLGENAKKGVPFNHFLNILRACLANHTLRRPRGDHPRLFILGLREARLMKLDRVILAGLNEGVWPSPPQPNLWHYTQLYHRLNLPSDADKISHDGFDFWQNCAGTPEVFLTRSLETSEGPTLPCRWLNYMLMAKDGQRWLEPHKGIHEAVIASLSGDAPMAQHDRKGANGHSPKPPSPSPRGEGGETGFTIPLGQRPDKLSITQAELLDKNPYIFAYHHILKLRPLTPLTDGLRTLTAQDFGQLTHLVLETYTRQRYTPNDGGGAMGGWTDATASFLSLAKKCLGEVVPPSVRGILNNPFWIQRLARLGDWICNEAEPSIVLIPPQEAFAPGEGDGGSIVRATDWVILPEILLEHRFGGGLLLKGKLDRLDCLAVRVPSREPQPPGSDPKLHGAGHDTRPTANGVTDHPGLGGRRFLRVVDYKTGRPPSQNDVLSGESLQLGLSAFLARHADHCADPLRESTMVARDVPLDIALAYWVIPGIGSPYVINFEGDNARQAEDAALERFKGLVALLEDPNYVFGPMGRGGSAGPGGPQASMVRDKGQRDYLFDDYVPLVRSYTKSQI